MMTPITHLTRDQHMQAAALSKQAQDALSELAKLVQRAPYTDLTLRVQRDFQGKLIDPLREAWGEAFEAPRQPVSERRLRAGSIAPGR